MNDYINLFLEYFLGWPLLIYVGIVCVLCTIFLSWLQFFYLPAAIRLILFPPVKKNSGAATSSDMTPVQAFINTLSTNLGNGTIAGMATAVYAGGPGAAIWFVLCAFLLMSVRYAEVFVSTIYGNKANNISLGGPMLYLQDMPAGKILAFVYAILCLFYGFIGGGAIQANSICLGLQTAFGVPAFFIACTLFLFILYVGFGGASRVVKISDMLVPIKVLLFFGSALVILLYHVSAIPAALVLMFKATFNPAAAHAALIGVGLQQAIQYGLMRSVFASESGLGTAAILFGSTGNAKPAESGLLGMMSTFVSAVACFVLALCIVVTGVWNSGLTSTALTVAAFNTTFGSIGGFLVTFLSIVFGLGVTVSYAYIVRACWLVIFPAKYEFLYVFVYAGFAAFGALAEVPLVWKLADIVQACMLYINLTALLIFVYRMKVDMIKQTQELVEH